MSDSDSFIDEVNEEVRRDRFYFMLKRYGWLAAFFVVLIVGGAAFNEYRKAQVSAEAEALGDAVLEAMAQDTAADRQIELSEIRGGSPGARAVVDLLIAAEAQAAGATEQAIATLENIAVNGDVPEIYRQVAVFKSLALQADTMDDATRRQQLEALAQPGQAMSLLAQEQLALMDISEGNTDAALDRLQAVIADANVTSDLQQRALQVIVALGGTPDMANLSNIGN